LVTDHLLDVWQKWATNADLKFITRSFEDAVEDCVLLFEEGTIPGDLRRLTGLVSELKTHWEAWKKRASVNPQRNQHPGANFWAVLEAMSTQRQVMKRPPPKRLEPVAKLKALPGMTDMQICRMYGFFDANGAPELFKVDEEEKEAGKHSYNIPGWLPPHERKRVEAERAQAATVDRVKEQRMAKIRQLTRPPAKESIEELLALQVSGKQICQMKQIEREDLELWCLEHKLKMPGWDAPSGNQILGDFDTDVMKADAARPAEMPVEPPAVFADPNRREVDPDAPASVIKAAVEEETAEEPAGVLAGKVEPPALKAEADVPTAAAGEMSIEAQIVVYHQGGLSAQQIATDMARIDPTCDVKKVRAVIRQYQHNPASIPIPEGMIVG
jgi:hypothetical protein